MLVLNTKELCKAVDLLRSGKVIIFPTETSYGLGCDATNQDAVNKIFAIKNRPKNKPLSIIVSDTKMAEQFLSSSEILKKITNKYWPGALTVVGLAHKKLSKGVISNQNTLAMRVSSHPAAKYLCEKLGGPIVATSANISGEDEIYDSQEVLKIFSTQTHRPDAILDYGKLPKRLPSTIISVISGRIKVLRKGEVKYVKSK